MFQKPAQSSHLLNWYVHVEELRVYGEEWLDEAGRFSMFITNIRGLITGQLGRGNKPEFKYRIKVRQKAFVDLIYYRIYPYKRPGGDAFFKRRGGGGGGGHYY